MNKPPPMGHNGGFAFDTRADIPKDVPRLFFFKCGIQDVLDDIMKMPKEERGVYMTALLVMYKEMEGLPADDKMAAMSLGLDVREWRHIKPKLIARGVLYERQSGRISNHRFEAEISAYVTEFKNRREAAVEREMKKREVVKIAPTSPRDRADIAERSPRDRRDVAPMSPTFPGGIGVDFSEKHNKINAAPTTSRAQGEHEAPLRARVLLTTSYESEIEKKEEHTNKQDSHHGAHVGAGGGEAVERGLDPNEAHAVHLLARLFGSETDPDTDRAMAIVVRWSASHGSRDVLDATLDFVARKSDRTELRQISERLFGDYVRQASVNRASRAETPIVPVAKPERQTVPVGPMGQGMEMAADGRIMLVNGMRNEWLKRFGGDGEGLDLALIEVSGRLTPNSPTPLDVQASGMLARICRDTLMADKRYERATAAKAARPTGGARAAVATDGERLGYEERQRKRIAEREAASGRTSE